ncbi:MAG TPA: iron-sulfur cluster assembly protein [Methylomirabilota bacterium]|nr:iron-sulfur cluster assembly protein [Methylomirabilota bacterium]
MGPHDRAPFIVIWETTRSVYRDSPAFTALRDPARLGGRCGRCEYREICGGSRARAFAGAGDPLAEDPGCAWRLAAGAPIAGGSDAAPPVSEGAVMQALGTVFDPELGMSIVDVGLVYEVRVRGGAVGITMTLTAPGCPIHDVMPEWVRTAVRRVPGVEHVEVTLTFEPAWTPDRIKR